MLVLFALAAVTTFRDVTYWYCDNNASNQQFTLSYEQRGNAISHVQVYVRGTPRLSSDTRTHWRAKATSSGAEFTFNDETFGQWGEMHLTYSQPNTGRSQLRWRNIIGLAGHIPIESEEEVAECQRSLPRDH